MRTLPLPLTFCLVAGLLAGCTTSRFLWQAGWGHVDVVTRAESIERLLRSPRTPRGLRALLREVAPIKAFAARHGLSATDNYTDYAELDREAVVWSVSACAPLAFDPFTWSFPVVGEIPYLGWFDQAVAEAYAEELRAEGWDVDVREVSAYSTLGWMADPLLSTMITRGPERGGSLANIILHESVHATLFIADQAVFNESLASFVADQMTRTYLVERYGATAVETRAYQLAEAAWQAERALLGRAYADLEALYSGPLPDEEKRRSKTAILLELMSELDADDEINNATLIDFATYRSGEQAFEALWEACDRSWPRLMTAVAGLEEALVEPEQTEIEALLAPLIAAGCVAGP